MVFYFTLVLHEGMEAGYPQKNNELSRGIEILFIVIGVTIGSVLVAIISSLMFRKNKKPIAASILLILFAIISTMLTYGTAILGGIFYLIAGFMGIKRKAEITQPRSDFLRIKNDAMAKCCP
ncbi:hypothetical protein [Gracilibacillus timonensis]|uniref:hypothetical protein n=1 Tax=Gracilibacillus timonensis TaxID=1816696 RepID=UPI00082427DA|nr:hypothetical protein [Gracilibacillus timonensis]